MSFHKISLSLILVLFIIGCSKDDSGNIDEGEPISPVYYDLEAMPYAKLSDYNFFSGELALHYPVYGVLPYEPISALFTDYAHKKRFVWMPDGSSAQYEEDGSILTFPVGSILIKSFYYDSLTGANPHKIIETRIMIKKVEGWIFADYIWNDEQTEAFYNLEGDVLPISFSHNGQNLSTQYRIPNETECMTCHKTSEVATPIGVKPQNLNKNYSYSSGSQNQLAKWQSMGYLGSYPTDILTVVDYADPSADLEERVRSYLDMNCAHCHSFGGHCDYTSMRFGFESSLNSENLGVCMPANETVVNYNFTYIVESGNVNRSSLSYRLHTTDDATKMPQLGRTLVHQEAVELIDQWIAALDQNCN